MKWTLFSRNRVSDLTTVLAELGIDIEKYDLPRVTKATSFSSITKLESDQGKQYALKFTTRNQENEIYDALRRSMVGESVRILKPVVAGTLEGGILKKLRSAIPIFSKKNQEVHFIIYEWFDSTLDERLSNCSFIRPSDDICEPIESFLRKEVLGLSAGVRDLVQAGISHGDIKPSNIFVTKNQDVVIGDLGSAVIAESENFVDTDSKFFSPTFKGATSYYIDAYMLSSTIVYSLAMLSHGLIEADVERLTRKSGEIIMSTPLQICSELLESIGIEIAREFLRICSEPLKATASQSRDWDSNRMKLFLDRLISTSLALPSKIDQIEIPVNVAPRGSARKIRIAQHQESCRQLGRCSHILLIPSKKSYYLLLHDENIESPVQVLRISQNRLVQFANSNEVSKIVIPPRGDRAWKPRRSNTSLEFTVVSGDVRISSSSLTSLRETYGRRAHELINIPILDPSGAELLSELNGLLQALARFAQMKCLKLRFDEQGERVYLLPDKVDGALPDNGSLIEVFGFEKSFAKEVEYEGERPYVTGLDVRTSDGRSVRLQISQPEIKAQLNRRRAAVERIGSQASSLQDSSALLKMLGREKPHDGAPYYSNLEISPNLSADKQSVISSIARESFSVVEGPPGTGKTTLIAEVALRFLRDNPGSRVLLTSNDHKAVDNALERILNLGSQAGIISHEEVVRVHSREFKKENWDEKVSTTYLANRAESLRAALMATNPVAGLLQGLKDDASFENCLKIVRRGSRIVAGTCNGIGVPQGFTPDSFDLCIIDEASRVTLIDALIPIAVSRKWVVVGDSQQLSPDIQGEELYFLNRKQTQMKYGYSPNIAFGSFMKWVVAQRNFVGSVNHALSSQHRMCFEIAQMVNEVSYGGLTTPRARTNQLSRSIDSLEIPIPRILWLSYPGDSAAEEKVGESKRNLREAEIAIVEMEQILRSMKSIARPEVPISAAFIAPHNSQKELLRTLWTIPSKRLRDDGISCVVDFESVTGSQGKEFDVTIFSLTHNNPSFKYGNLVFDALGNSTGSLITVAISRSREIFRVIGSIANVEAHQSDSSHLRRLANYFRQAHLIKTLG